MHVKVTRPFKCVPPGEVYPRLFAEGAIVEGRVAEVALDYKSGEEMKGGAKAKTEPKPKSPPSQDPPPPPVVRAKLTKAHTITDADGKEVKLAKGAVVDGDLASLLIAEGVAEEVAPENKANAGAPATK